MLSRSNFTQILDSLMSHKGVYAVVIASSEGFPLTFRSRDGTFSATDAEKTAALFSALVGRAQNAVNQIGRGDVNFFTIDITTGEILVALEDDYVVIAIRDKKINPV